MERNLQKQKLTGYVKNLRGDVTNLSGDVSNLSGDVDDCNITNSELFREYEAEYQNKKFYQIEKSMGRKEIIIKCKYDIKLIKQFIQKFVKGNLSRYIREYKGQINIMQKNNNYKFESDHIKEIKKTTTKGKQELIFKI
jgi:hypothetical protein